MKRTISKPPRTLSVIHQAIKGEKFKLKKSDFEKVREFWAADPQTFFLQDYIAPVRGVGIATLENERWKGIGIPYRKVYGRILYRKSDVISFLEAHELVNSTSQYRQKEEEKLEVNND